MSYEVLARRWRPRSFAEMAGQEHVLRALINALDQGRLHQAYLFTGTRGVGKTTIARILAKALNCEEGVSSKPCGQCSACTEINEGRFIDLIEVDAASRTKVEDTRELLDNVQYAPTRGRYKVYLIDEVHMLSNHSFNALLKTLEEPPPHVKFLLATTDPQKLPATVLSRCLQFNLKRMPVDLIEGQLCKILNEDAIGHDATSLKYIAKSADGSMRDALSLLDQAIAYGEGALVATDVAAMLGYISREPLYELLQSLIARDAGTLIKAVANLEESAADYNAVLDELISLLQQLALAQWAEQAIDTSFDDKEQLLEYARQLSAEDVQLYYQIALIGKRDLYLSPSPKRGLEMVLLRMLAFKPVDTSGKPSAGQNQPNQNQPNKAPLASKSASANASPTVNSQVAAPKEHKTSVRNARPERWQDIFPQLGLKGMVAELGANCEIKVWEENELTLQLATKHAQLYNKSLETRLAEAISGYMERTIKLSIDVGELQTESPAVEAARHVNEQQQRAVDAIEQDQFVKALQDEFGAEVKKESIRPLDQ